MDFESRSLMNNVGIYATKSTEKVSDLKRYFWLRNFGLFETATIKCSLILPDDHWMRVIVEDNGY